MKENKVEKIVENKKNNEHLKEGISPIMACVGKPQDFKHEEKIIRFFCREINHAHDLDWGENFEELKEEGFENDGSDSYLISPLDSLDKYSKNYFNCTGLILSGKEKGSGKNISFMTHQNPEYFLIDNGKNFLKDLIKKIKELKERCEDKTIDAAVVGGSYSKVRDFKEPDPKRDIFIQEYLKSIKFLSEKIKKEIGFEPIVIVGPKTEPGSDIVFYENDTKRLYLMRNRGGGGFDSAESFLPSELEEKRKKWKPGEWSLPI
jgi:hypothetical protein